MSAEEVPTPPPQTLELPANSFTASRFLYGSSAEVSAAAEVVLLGGVPKLWFREQKNLLLNTWKRRTVSDAEHSFDEFNSHTKRLGLKDISSDSRARKLLKLMRRSPDSDSESDGGSESDEDSVRLETDNAGQQTLHTFTEEMELLAPTMSRRIEDEEDEDGDFGLSSQSQHLPMTTQTMGPPTLTPDAPSATHTNGTVANISEQREPQGVQESTSMLSIPRSNKTAQTSTTNQSFYTAHGSTASQASKESTSTLPAKDNTCDVAPQIVVDESSDSRMSANGTITRNGTHSQPSLVSFVSKSSNTSPEPRPMTAEPISTQEYLDSESVFAPKVRFTESSGKPRSKSKSSQMQILRPSPSVGVQVQELDRKRELAVERVKTVATMTKRKLKKDVKRIRYKKLYSRFIKSFRAGEIINMEKMLVLVKTPGGGAKVSGFTEFTDVEPCDTRVLERWKEYIVVARSTGDIEGPILLQFYTNREIPDNEDSKHSKDLLDFTLTKDCHVNFYNTLDRTISLVKDDKIFILRCQTPTSSIRWLTFFNEILGKHYPSSIKVEIPRLKMAITLNLPHSFYQDLLDFKFERVKLEQRDIGYYMVKQPIVQEISNKVRKKLINAGYGDVMDEFDQEENIIGVCWRYYDRLEWLFGETLGNLFFQQAMHFTHELEFRYVKHYPRVATIKDSRRTMAEPAPVEGFLVRLTTHEGNLKRGLAKRQVISFDYFSTCDHLLFFCKSHKAIPPMPFNDEIFDKKHLSKEDFEKVSESLEWVHYNNPFALDPQGHVTWLKPGMDQEQFHKRDVYAVYEFERRVNMVRGSDVLDLLDTESIHVFDPRDVPLNVELSSSFIWGETMNFKELGNLERDTYFVIVLKNGLSMVLKAQNRHMRDEWVTRLNELKNYWTLRRTEDKELIRSIRDENAVKLNMDDGNEADVFEMSPKWESTRGEAKSEIFNITPYAMFRPIIRSGFLFQKPKKHSTFVKYFVVTVPGYIVLYKIVTRSFGGVIKPTTHYKHYITVPLKECYIYSGSICGLDLLTRDDEVDSVKPGKISLPRVYEDGWLSSDDELTRCFTLWFGSKRAIAGRALQKLNHEENSLKNPNLIKMVSRLGVTGQSMVFMCRSRQERDLWVSNLYTELERFGRANEN